MTVHGKDQPRQAGRSLTDEEFEILRGLTLDMRIVKAPSGWQFAGSPKDTISPAAIDRLLSEGLLAHADDGQSMVITIGGSELINRITSAAVSRNLDWIKRLAGPKLTE